jgi:DNA-binding MarR family transcriptional regulator
MQVDSAELNPETVAAKLNSAAIHLLRSISRGDTTGGLTSARLSALSVVVYAGPLTMSRLAAAEGVRLPTMSRLVGSLEADGYVSRVADAHDHRAVLVAATASGASVLEEARTRRIADLAGRLGSHPQEDVALLDRAADLIEELVQGTPSAHLP